MFYICSFLMLLLLSRLNDDDDGSAGVPSCCLCCHVKWSGPMSPINGNNMTIVSRGSQFVCLHTEPSLIGNVSISKSTLLVSYTNCILAAVILLHCHFTANQISHGNVSGLVWRKQRCTHGHTWAITQLVLVVSQINLAILFVAST